MENKLKTGSITTIIAYLTGNILHLDQTAQANIIFVAQLMAFSVSIIVGILTACYYIKKLRTKKNE